MILSTANHNALVAATIANENHIDFAQNSQKAIPAQKER
jgi:hypothetical protein